MRKNTRGELDDNVRKRVLHNSNITDARLAHTTTLLKRADFKAKISIKSSTDVIHEGEEFTRVAMKRSLVKNSKLEATTIPLSPKLHTMKRNYQRRGSTALNSFQKGQGRNLLKNNSGKEALWHPQRFMNSTRNSVNLLQHNNPTTTTNSRRDL